jgi:hypothetical protein
MLVVEEVVVLVVLLVLQVLVEVEQALQDQMKQVLLELQEQAVQTLVEVAVEVPLLDHQHLEHHLVVQVDLVWLSFAGKIRRQMQILQCSLHQQPGLLRLVRHRWNTWSLLVAVEEEAVLQVAAVLVDLEQVLVIQLLQVIPTQLQ